MMYLFVSVKETKQRNFIFLLPKNTLNVGWRKYVLLRVSLLLRNDY